eukprot:5257208-Prymnesium_polylepis.2
MSAAKKRARIVRPDQQATECVETGSCGPCGDTRPQILLCGSHDRCDRLERSHSSASHGHMGCRKSANGRRAHWDSTHGGRQTPPPTGRLQPLHAGSGRLQARDHVIRAFPPPPRVAYCQSGIAPCVLV